MSSVNAAPPLQGQQTTPLANAIPKSLAQKRDWLHEMHRLQQYLGLKKSDGVSNEITTSGVTSTLEEDEPMPLQCSNTDDAPALLVSVDVEAFEFNQSLITEVGISVLDCWHITNVPPDQGGRTWMSNITSRHFRVSEYKHLVNKKFVYGCPDNFDFGRSEWISRNNLPQLLKEYFQSLQDLPFLETPAKRRIVLVGHNVQSDVKYLASLGFDPSTVFPDSIDTINLQRVLNRHFKHQGLTKLMAQYNLPAEHPHNAGNDACYTLQVAIVMALEYSVNRKTSTQWQAEEDARIEQAIKEAIVKVKQEFQGWSSSDENEEGSADEDGGDAAGDENYAANYNVEELPATTQLGGGHKTVSPHHPPQNAPKVRATSGRRQPPNLPLRQTRHEAAEGFLAPRRSQRTGAYQTPYPRGPLSYADESSATAERGWRGSGVPRGAWRSSDRGLDRGRRGRGGGQAGSRGGY